MPSCEHGGAPQGERAIPEHGGGDMKLTHDGEEQLFGDAPLHPEQGECDAVQCGDHHGQPVGEDGAAVGPAGEVQRPDLWAMLAQGAPPDEDLSGVVIKELDLQTSTLARRSITAGRMSQSATSGWQYR